MKQIIVHSGQRVIGTDGKVHTVAYVRNGNVWAYSNRGFVLIRVVSDAWGSEYDQEIGIAA